MLGASWGGFRELMRGPSFKQEENLCGPGEVVGGSCNRGAGEIPRALKRSGRRGGGRWQEVTLLGYLVTTSSKAPDRRRRTKLSHSVRRSC